MSEVNNEDEDDDDDDDEGSEEVCYLPIIQFSLKSLCCFCACSDLNHIPFPFLAG